MITAEWLSLLHLLYGTPDKIDKIQKERHEAYKCVQEKRCYSVWKSEIGDWVVYPYSEEEIREIKSSEHLKKE